LTKNINITKDDLVPYVEQGLSFQKIANIFDINYTCIRNLCSKFNLKTKCIVSREIDLVGIVFGRLTVFKENGRDKEHRKTWLCQCSCSNKTEISVNTHSLISGNTKSCGCIASEIIIERNKKSTREFSTEERDVVLKSYIEGNTIGYIRKKFKIAEYLVAKILSDANVNLRGKPFNEHYFEKIDTQEKAYWLGFLYADGCVNKTSLELGLQSRDKNHIEKFVVALDATEYLHIKDRTTKVNGKKFKSNRVVLNSEIIVNNLINNGCVRNKSLVIRFPTLEIIPLLLQSHFIRGYFDGDGCVGFYNNKIAIVDIISNEPFLLEMQKIFVEQCNLNYVKLKKHHTSKNVKYLRYGGSHQIYKIYNYLYKDAEVFLDRKYDKFQLFLEFYKDKYNIS